MKLKVPGLFSADELVKEEIVATAATETAIRFTATISQPAKKKAKRGPVVRPDEGWDTPAYYFKWNWSPFKDFPAPRPEQAALVFEILRVDLQKHGISVELGERGDPATSPAHGAAIGVTVDALVRTILSQATNNEGALGVQELLRKAYQYTVNGKKVKGNTPNYHLIRRAPKSELVRVLQPGGLQNSRADFIKGILDAVFKANTEEIENLDEDAAGNPPDAPDFVPGFLSLEYLKEMSKEDLFTTFCNFKGVGPKTAQCLLEFNYNYPVCAVDTHVHYMAAALNWIPRDCNNAVKAAMHLDARLPDYLKHGLHQAFWHHRQSCPACKKEVSKVTKADSAQCVLDHLMERRVVREKGKEVNKEVAKEKREQALKDKALKKEAGEKAPWVDYKKFTLEQATKEGYYLYTYEINDDFNAGSENKKPKSIWMLKEEE